MGKLISFPSKTSNKVTALQRREARRLALALSLLSVAVMAITLNERLRSDQRPQYVLAGEKLSQLNRAIASAQPFNLIEDVQTEHDWAKKMSDYERRPAAIGQRPSKEDQFRYGQLAGKYRIEGKSDHISEVEYVDSSDITDRPVMVRDSQGFLLENKELFAVHFEKAEVDSKSTRDETFKLFNNTGQVVGRAAFQYDSAGHLLSLKVQDSQ